MGPQVLVERSQAKGQQNCLIAGKAVGDVKQVHPALVLGVLTEAFKQNFKNFRKSRPGNFIIML